MEINKQIRIQDLSCGDEATFLPDLTLSKFGNAFVVPAKGVAGMGSGVVFVFPNSPVTIANWFLNVC